MGRTGSGRSRPAFEWHPDSRCEAGCDLSARVTAARAPHIYFIMAQGCFYVGETQRRPISRWSQHLEPQGSLVAALGRQEDLRSDLDGRIAFYAVEIEALPVMFPQVQVRSATQAVEHEVHVLLWTRPMILGASMRVISDTQRTAPRTFRRWDVATALAGEVVATLREAMTARPLAMGGGRR